MESTRQAKVNRLLQRELATYFQRNAQSLIGVQFITVSKVLVTVDLSLAKVYVTFLNAQNPLELVAKLNELKTEIKRQMAQKLRNDLRKLPDLNFYYDDTLDYVDKIESILDDINSKKG